MARNHKTITISLPKELDSLIDRLVNESKSTAKPFTKSNFIALACYDFIEKSLNILNSLNPDKKKEEC